MTRTVWLIGVGLVVAGLFLLAFLAGFVVRPAIANPVLAWLPPLPPAWLTTLNVAAAIALAAVALGGLGVLLARRQSELMRRERMRREDRLRRVHLYRDEARREPFLGPGAAGRQDSRPRRVA
jgi:membrane protein implicated in regulation of membrane protease activity